MQQFYSDDDTSNPYDSYSRSALVGRIHQLERANELAWNKIKELQKFERQFLWQRQLHSVKNNQTNAADKLVAVELKQISDDKTPNEHGVYPLYIPAIAENTGLSDDTVSKSLRKFDKAGQIVYKVGRDKEGKTHSSFIPGAKFLEKPQEMTLKEDSNHGGKRIKCASCGSEDIIERRICRGCGTVLKEREVNKAVEEDDEDEEVNHSVHTEPSNIIPFPVLKRGCNHSEEYRFRDVNGKECCRICNAPWEVPHAD